MDERGRGKTGTGQWPMFVLKEIGSVERAERGKRRVSVGTSARRREKEERGEAWHCDRQRGAADNVPRPAGAGDVVAARTEVGGGRGRHGDTSEGG
jgi:hypothetical protein